jgi:hypothetical protein
MFGGRKSNSGILERRRIPLAKALLAYHARIFWLVGAKEDIINLVSLIIEIN